MVGFNNTGPIAKRKGRIKRGISFVKPGKFWKIRKNK